MNVYCLLVLDKTGIFQRFNSEVLGIWICLSTAYCPSPICCTRFQCEALAGNAAAPDVQWTRNLFSPAIWTQEVAVFFYERLLGDIPVCFYYSKSGFSAFSSKEDCIQRANFKGQIRRLCICFIAPNSKTIWQLYGLLPLIFLGGWLPENL